jgi:hypothetical protein
LGHLHTPSFRYHDVRIAREANTGACACGLLSDWLRNRKSAPRAPIPPSNLSRYGSYFLA